MSAGRILCRRPIALVLFLVAYLAAGVFSSYWLGALTSHPAAADFGIYYSAYLRAESGGNPYTPYAVGKSFVYHPFALTFISLISWPKNETIAYLVWSAAGIHAWLASGLIVLKLIEVRSLFASIPAHKLHVLLLLLLLSFAPFLETIHIGQINTFAVLCLYLCIYLAEDGKSIASGFCLALAISFKTSPLVFIAYFLVVRRPRVVASTLVSLAALSVVAALQFSPSVLSEFWTTLGRLGSEIHPTRYNQSMLSIAYRAVSGLGWRNIDEALLLAHRVVFGGTTAILLASGLLIPGRSGGLRFQLLLSLLALMIVSSPLVWYHHSVFLLLPLAALLLEGSAANLCLVGSMVLLVQLDRAFEYVAARVALPVALAHLVLTGALIHSYLTQWWIVSGRERASTSRRMGP